jgi:hypothetical protein
MWFAVGFGLGFCAGFYWAAFACLRLVRRTAARHDAEIAALQRSHEVWRRFYVGRDRADRPN